MRNLYARPDEFTASLAAPEQDAADDAVILRILEATSRYIDSATRRQFTPTIATKSYDAPEGREMWLGEDLLAATTITNGDGDAIASTEYVLHPSNSYPKYAIKLRDSSSETWEEDDDASAEQVIDILGVWGYNDDYTNAWRTSGAVLSAAIATTTATTFTCTTGIIKTGMLLKIDSEYLQVTGTAQGTTDTITVTRGANGSTAAAHLISTAVYYWEVQPDITQAALDIAMSIYKRRYGENTASAATVTAVGVVVTPRDVPAMAADILRRYARMVA